MENPSWKNERRSVEERHYYIKAQIARNIYAHKITFIMHIKKESKTR